MKFHFNATPFLFLLGFILLFVFPAASAEIYKWKDKDGNVFYSDTPPPAGMDAEMKKLKEEFPPAQKPRPEISSPLPKGDITKEKRPYSSIHVIMYMTTW